MTHYDPASTETNALLLSDALFALAVPSHLQSADGRQDAFEVITALNGSPWLVVPDEFTLVMHPQAEINGLADVLLPYESQGYIPAGTIAGLEAWIEATRVLPTVAERTFCSLGLTRAFCQRIPMKLWAHLSSRRGVNGLFLGKPSLSFLKMPASHVMNWFPSACFHQI